MSACNLLRPLRRPSLAAVIALASVAAPASASEVYIQLIWQFSVPPQYANTYASAVVLGSIEQYTLDLISVRQNHGTTIDEDFTLADLEFDQADGPPAGADISANASVDAGMTDWPANAGVNPNWDFYAAFGDQLPRGWEAEAHSRAHDRTLNIQVRSGYHRSRYRTVEYGYHPSQTVDREIKWTAGISGIVHTSAVLAFAAPASVTSFTATIKPRFVIAHDHDVDPAPPDPALTEGWAQLADPATYVTVYANGTRLAYGAVGMNEFGDVFTIRDISVNGTGDFVFNGNLANIGGDVEVEVSVDARGRLPGDLDDDGDVDAADITALQTLARNNYAVTGDFDPADVNCDDDVTLAYAAGADSDVALVVRTVLKTQFGDFNLDGRVNLADQNVLQSYFGQSGGWADGDATGDGLVNLADYNVVRTNFGFVRP